MRNQLLTSLRKHVAYAFFFTTLFALTEGIGQNSQKLETGTPSKNLVKGRSVSTSQMVLLMAKRPAKEHYCQTGHYNPLEQ